MKREFWVCSAIFLYCLFAAYITFGLLRTPETTSYAQASEITPPVNTHFATTLDTPDPNQVFELVNKERVVEGSPALRADEKLGKLAAARAADMAKRQYYAHKNPDGKYYYDFFSAYGLASDYSCENLDLVFTPSNETFINEWLASTKGHRNCMINPSLTEAGYATTKLTLVDYDGKPTMAYLVVAIHTTPLH